MKIDCTLRLAIAIAAGVASAQMAGPAHAIVTASGASPALPAGLNLNGVGQISNNCSSVLLSGGGWVLASAHCAASPGATVTFAGGIVGVVAQTFIAPGYADPAVNDLSLSRLVVPVVGVSGYDIGSSLTLPTSVVVAGFGDGGNGTTGPTLPSGVLRYGFNDYEQLLADDPPTFYNGTVVGFDFDSGQAAENRFGSLGQGAGEAGLAIYDSGGPSFAQISGQWVIVGIHSAVDDRYGLTFGGIGYDVLTASYAGWIAQTTAVPEPEPATLLAGGLLLLALLQAARSGNFTRVSNLARLTLK